MSQPAFTYRPTARLLHWSMAVLVLLMIPAGFLMVQDWVARDLRNTLFIFHKNVGVLLLGLIVVRILYRWRHAPAALPTDVPGWQRRASGLSHLGLYALLLVMPLAGYTRVKAGGFPIETLDWMGVPALVPRSDALAEVAKAIHYYAGFAIAALIGLHVAAAAYHGLVRRDGVFSRMWPRAGAGDA